MPDFKPRTGFALVATCLLLMGCAAGNAPPPVSAELPFQPGRGAGDPARGAILATSYAFSTPSSIMGQPALAAEIIAQLEYLAVEIPTGPRWISFNPNIGRGLWQARTETREALGISPVAPPQVVIDALYTAARSLRAGDPAGAERALTIGTFASPQATLQRLAHLPRLPMAALATRQAANEMTTLERDRRAFNGNPGFQRASW